MLSDRLIRAISNWRVSPGPEDDVENLIEKGTLKVLNFRTLEIYCCTHPKIQTNWPYSREMPPKDAEGIANSEDPDQTAPLGAVLSGSALLCPDLSVRKN